MGRLTALVLGSAAGGGFPQWNCRCPTCRLAWAGDARVRPRTQASIAVSADGDNWLLINAPPIFPSSFGVEISARGAQIVYIPGAAAITAAMTKRIARADVVFFDGTLFRDDEMI